MIRFAHIVRATLSSSLCLLVGTAAARPVYWAAVPQVSTIEVIASALDGALTASASTTVSSTAAARADLVGDVAPGVLSLLSGSVLLDDRSLSFDLGEFGHIDASIVGVMARLPVGQFGPIASVPGPPGFARYDLSGAELRIDGGVLNYAGTGSLGGLLGTGTLDFSASPLLFSAPAGTTANLLKTAPGPRGGELVLFGVPLDIQTPVIQDPLPIDVRIRGQILLYGFRAGTGSALQVPEPGSAALFVIGVVMAWAGRHLRRRSASRPC